MSCRVRLIGSIIKLSRAWHGGPEVRPKHSPVQASGRHDPLSFVQDHARAEPILSCFGSTHLV
jgi:hypothetical protein